jgi:hypothetical protein
VAGWAAGGGFDPGPVEAEIAEDRPPGVGELIKEACDRQEGLELATSRLAGRLGGLLRPDHSATAEGKRDRPEPSGASGGSAVRGVLADLLQRQLRLSRAIDDLAERVDL